MARQRPGGQAGNPSTLRVLRAVELHQRPGGGACIGDVAEYLGVEHSTASRTVSAIVAAGLLTKTPAAEDQRRSVLMLTEAGRTTLSSVTQQHRDLVADWPDADIDTLVTLLTRLAERVEIASGGP